MSENPTIAMPDFDNGICFGPKAFPASTAAMELRLMMKRAEGEDKCVLCRAAQELEKSALKPNSGNWAFSFPTMLLMLSALWGDNFDIDPDGLKAYMDAVEKKRKENSERKDN